MNCSSILPHPLQPSSSYTGLFIHPTSFILNWIVQPSYLMLSRPTTISRRCSSWIHAYFTSYPSYFLSYLILLHVLPHPTSSYPILPHPTSSYFLSYPSYPSYFLSYFHSFQYNVMITSSSFSYEHLLIA